MGCAEAKAVSCCPQGPLFHPSSPQTPPHPCPALLCVCRRVRTQLQPPVTQQGQSQSCLLPVPCVGAGTRGQRGSRGVTAAVTSATRRGELSFVHPHVRNRLGDAAEETGRVSCLGSAPPGAAPCPEPSPSPSSSPGHGGTTVPRAQGSSAIPARCPRLCQELLQRHTKLC